GPRPAGHPLTHRIAPALHTSATPSAPAELVGPALVTTYRPLSRLDVAARRTGETWGPSISAWADIAACTRTLRRLRSPLDANWAP
ncbi:hypothetical protein ABT173_21930, partial [Streptomyces sp. NPDC001795]|uniref:hypothetical protein n=1 Tax=Streptomyces sp. NPDC001795 TaxID=3154525 RepID=UPI00331C01E7